MRVKEWLLELTPQKQVKITEWMVHDNLLEEGKTYFATWRKGLRAGTYKSLHMQITYRNHLVIVKS